MRRITLIVRPFLALLTAWATLALGAPAIATDGLLFSDVEPGDEHYVAIQYMKERELVEGYEDGTFKPYQEINRAEALKVLLGAITKEQNTDTTDFYFPDVSPTDWYFEYVVAAFNSGLVEGYPDGSFHPEKTINKAESLKVALIHEGGFIPEEATAPPYSDVPTDVWYAPYAEVAKNRTLFLESRENGALNAGENMNRGDFVELIYRMLESSDGAVFARTTWYGHEGVDWGTASGEPFHYNAMTAAHKTLPFGTKLLVTNLANGKSVEVTVNDRGPYPIGIDLDLTQGAFSSIASVGAGIINTKFKVIDQPLGEPMTEEPATKEIPEYGF